MKKILLFILILAPFCYSQNSPFPDIDRLYSKIQQTQKSIDDRNVESMMNEGKPSQVITNILSLIKIDLNSLREMKLHYEYFNISKNKDGCEEIMFKAMGEYIFLKDVFIESASFHVMLIRKNFVKHTNPYEVSLFLKAANDLEFVIKELN